MIANLAIDGGGSEGDDDGRRRRKDDWKRRSGWWKMVDAMVDARAAGEAAAKPIPRVDRDDSLCFFRTRTTANKDRS